MGPARWVTSAMKVAIFSGMQHGVPWIGSSGGAGAWLDCAMFWRAWHGTVVPNSRPNVTASLVLARHYLMQPDREA